MFRDADMLGRLDRCCKVGELKIILELEKSMVPRSQVEVAKPWFWVGLDL
jgi:hypothetical protein